MISIDAGCCSNYKRIRLFHSHLSNILPDILQLHWRICLLEAREIKARPDPFRSAFANTLLKSFSNTEYIDKISSAKDTPKIFA